ncbi:NAD(P) transhydrogenase subunit alpha [Candidatus Formimonas warabiya]|uniref:proton-translocating NAD(P)(+) transhydrogenase n=1 Tax=Formimonas warabiya TaxID=1761012 RepID=A0A3G1KVQ7_FORW1|nr:NAD(P) transhydrogenase subunit alpha [Candidatus Formimonas warabiya]ATW26526.1 NAD(P)(+) transhydrogenase [Candidatus Formimonas warabiya]
MNALLLIALFIAATLAGYKVISNVPSLLHTPLMSGMNALSGVTVLGALVATALAVVTVHKWLGAVAIVLATINTVGGFYVTHRMLKMFKTRG